MFRGVRRTPVLCILAALVLLSAGVSGVAGAVSREPVPYRTASLALGRPADGSLQNAVQLSETRWLHFKHGSPSHERWGTEELVSLVRNVAERVARQLPGATLPVGDLSHERGGPMRPHRSHRNGRDVDLAFYFTDPDGRAVRTTRLVRVRSNGTARSAGRALRFDDARNWKLVEGLLTAPHAEIESILVASHVERRLLAEARRQRASTYLYQRARLVMYQPRRGGRHDDHFHVRIHCPNDDRPQCVDGAPVMPILPPFTATR